MPDIIAIEDAADERIAGYRDIRERDLVGRQGLFIAEGEVVLRMLARSPDHEALSVLIAEKRLTSLMPILSELPDTIPVYTAGQAVLDGIAGFHLHRGILALGRRMAAPTADELCANARPDALIVVLFGIANHDNIGGIFRNAAAFGADGLLLDETCCDPLYRKATRVSVGATLSVPYARLGQGEDGIALIERHGFEAVSLSPAGATPLRRFVRSGRTAVIFGAEGPGLSPEVLARTKTVSIPMATGFDSLNVATTSGIVLHQLTG
ncbi:tRNA G18 (ribose-2'-O)-methylase SpoU [Faunimonas pinastri]|uniref:tRNA G18 (Ribose-2'-O)-methylase SpoU n=1 Tax=Faunimonas pinastri TaxID=1855383 RepID=A0A1H9KZG9_9HYPH|nr:RNA methyltransferase [Faunimonas pinastri]SER04287.1 tRNA G18 (ribose-2'-O)-methylase SpoU [Faunimonas pinastri]